MHSHNHGTVAILVPVSLLTLAALTPAYTGIPTHLEASDGSSGDRFGVVAIHGTTALVGASDDDDNGLGSGSAYLFDTANGLLRTKIVPAMGFSQDNYGLGVSISGTLALISSLGFDVVSNVVIGTAGRVHVYEAEEARIITSLESTEPDSFDKYGSSVAIRGTRVLIREPSGSFNGQDKGMADLYRFDAGTVTSRNGSGVNADILTCVTLPIVGADWETDLDTTGPLSILCGAVVYEAPFEGLFLNGGELLVDVTTVELYTDVAFIVDPVVRLSITFPLDLSLCGTPFSAQGIVFRSPSGCALSNALDGVIGF